MAAVGWGPCRGQLWGLVLSPNPATAFPADLPSQRDRRLVSSANIGRVTRSLHPAAPLLPTEAPGRSGCPCRVTRSHWVVVTERPPCAAVEGCPGHNVKQEGMIVGDVTLLGRQGGPLGRVSLQGPSGLQSPQLQPSPSPSSHRPWGRCYSHPQCVAEEIGGECGCRAGRSPRRPERGVGAGRAIAGPLPAPKALTRAHGREAGLSWGSHGQCLVTDRAPPSTAPRAPRPSTHLSATRSAAS